MDIILTVSRAPQVDATHCSVCELALEAHTAALCNSCGRAYHLNQRQDLEGLDCGQVWINEEHMALEFACNACLNPPSAALDDILDLAEAAEFAALTVAALEAAAAQGLVRHRRTASGTLLFVRADIQAYLGNAG